MKKIKTGKKRSMFFKFAFIAVGAFLLSWFLAPLVINGILNAGNFTGIVLSGGIIVCGVFLDEIAPLFAYAQRDVLGILAKSFLSLVLVALVIMGVTFSSMGRALYNQPGKNETVILLGCAVKGEHPSRMLRQRIDAAYDYMKENEGSVAVLSGGQGADEIMSEAECMRRELVKRGIDEKRLYLEDKSTNTQENIAFSTKIIRENNLPENVTVVTSDFHEKRGAMLCIENGLNPSSTPAKTDFYLAGTYWLREFFGVVKTFIF